MKRMCRKDSEFYLGIILPINWKRDFLPNPLLFSRKYITEMQHLKDDNARGLLKIKIQYVRAKICKLDITQFKPWFVEGALNITLSCLQHLRLDPGFDMLGRVLRCHPSQPISSQQMHTIEPEDGHAKYLGFYAFQIICLAFFSRKKISSAELPMETPAGGLGLILHNGSVGICPNSVFSGPGGTVYGSLSNLFD